MAEVSNIDKLLGAFQGRQDRLAATRLLGQLSSQEVRPESELLQDPNFVELNRRFPEKGTEFQNERAQIRQALMVEDEASEQAFFKDMRNVMTRLEGGDLTGAKSVFLNRKIALNQIPGAESDDVDRILGKLENEDFQGAYQDLVMADQIAVRNGILPGMTQPEGFTLSDGEVRFDAQGNQIASNIVEEEVTPEGFTLSDGQQRFDADGNLIAENVADETDENITSSQRLAAGFAKRTQDSGNIITELGGQFTGLPSRFGGLLPQGIKSEDRQKFEQATRDFINATLRRESGAAIAPTEFDNANLQYIPQPGDSDEVLEQKRRNRETISNALALEGGPAFDELQNLDNTVDILGKRMTVGSIVENAQGQRGRVEADGSITVLE